MLVAACAPVHLRSEPAPAVAPAIAHGPASGALVIAGGGELGGTGIVEAFIRRAGGPDARIVVIPTADGGDGYDDGWSGLELFRAAGARNLTVLHTYDAAEADREEFVRPLLEADGVWFPGGRQFRLAQAYLDTRTHREIAHVLERGGVVGGSSAGASILASFLIRGSPAGNHIVMEPGHDRGFGLLANTAVDQHLLARNRQRDMLQVLAVYPALLGIGIDESTAILVEGDVFDVIGRSRVAVYDGSARARRAGYFFLRPGDRYDLRGRSILPPISSTARSLPEGPAQPITEPFLHRA